MRHPLRSWKFSVLRCSTNINFRLAKKLLKNFCKKSIDIIQEEDICPDQTTGLLSLVELTNRGLRTNEPLRIAFMAKLLIPLALKIEILELHVQCALNKIGATKFRPASSVNLRKHLKFAETSGKN